jgi:hypothetical protein
MDNHYPITERIEQVAAHLQLIADLLLGGNDLNDVDRANFAFVMQRLATQLEEAVREKASTILGMNGTDRERQP